MTRRQFLRFKPGGRREICCRALFMRVLDLETKREEGELINRVRAALRGAPEIAVHNPDWLVCEQLSHTLKPLLEQFQRSGCRVTYLDAPREG